MNTAELQIAIEARKASEMALKSITLANEDICTMLDALIQTAA